MEAAVAATTSSLLLVSGPRRSSPTTLPSPSSLRPSCKICCSFTTSTARRQQQGHLASCLAAPRLSSKGSSRSISWRCSSSATGGSSTAVSTEKWILDPAGDGDWRHIGYKVARPGAIEIVSDAVTVGRVADKADIVLPVATVSGTHARLEKKGGSLLVTDLDSTNGTYINERRLNPGFPVPIDPGSLLIFGDIHLAMFRVRKMRVEVPSTEAEGAEQETKTEVVSAAAVEDTAS
ncbi:unnamed protein product [Miscanthus lutarioriparius]|uniref:FHA domain-containing protein n=1 Tax=Miscanthus lutarioriparius TaxID=422564 RepID=A0A811RK00_9POAL|nr:unnamed protein product [Miscanthus lutarioriparius]